ncbi:hypothetical protein HYQ45_004426 [Verticillium longisporum]|uniref:Uncharacterized protein n=1 Tax=Verticillium longisporum TaxID=100787 RepID=A0A8I2ZV86_VERLO|nr:hypothetical protein HYQ45_004426 [Verticillium longisporum]
MAHKSFARIIPDRDLEYAYSSYDKDDRLQLGKTATTDPNDERQIHRPEKRDESRRKKSSSGDQPVDSQDTTTTTTEVQLTGRTVPRAYPPCDACVTRGRSCSQYRPCASCHGAGDTCTDSRALHALGNLEPPGRKRKLGGLTDEQGRPIKRGRMEVLKGPCASCAEAGTAVPCDADHRLRIECTACADVRAVRGPDHECVAAETTVYMPKRSRWTRAPYSNIAQVVHWGCEGCRGRSYRRCDVDPRVGVGCTECAVRGHECRFMPDKREPDDVKTLWRRPLKAEFERNPGPAWWRRRCGRCAARGLNCSWLADYRNIGFKCQNCVDEQSKERYKVPDAVVECFDAEDGYTLCLREMENMRDDGSLVLPTKIVNRKVPCSLCRRGGSRQKCREYEGLGDVACVRCNTWGLPCYDKADEPGHPSGDADHSGEFPKPKPYADLQVIGWGSGTRTMMEYSVCKPCEAGDHNCDRQRPCDKCVELGDAQQCTFIPRVKDMPAGLFRRSAFTGAGVVPKVSMLPPSYYMALGFGPFGVDDDRAGPMRGIGVPGPQWGMWQVRVSDPDESNTATNNRPETRKLVRRGNRVILHRKPVDTGEQPPSEDDPPKDEQHDQRLPQPKVKKQSEPPVVLGPQGYPVYPEVKEEEDEDIVMYDGSFDFDNDLDNDDESMAILHNDYPVFEPCPLPTEEDLDDAAILAELNSLFDPSSRFLKAYLGENALPPVDGELDGLWLVPPPERVLLTLQSQDASAVARHPWAAAEDPTRRNDRANHLLTKWQRPSGTNILAAIPDEQDVFSPDLQNPCPPCREPTRPDDTSQTCQTPCPDENAVCASRHHLFDPAGPRPVCPACDTRSVTDTLHGPNRLTGADILSLRTYACSHCTSAEVQTGGGATADSNTTIARSAQHPLTGCLCGTKLLGRPLCAAHRATLAARAVIQAALVREWQVVNFAPDQCMFCKVRGGGDMSATMPGRDTPSVFHCSVCARVVEDGGRMPTLFPGYEGWAAGAGAAAFRANEGMPMAARVPAWGAGGPGL